MPATLEFPRAPAGLGGVGSMLDVVAYLRQWTTWRFKYPLTDDDYRPIVYTLRGEIVSGTTSRTITQRIATNYVFLLREIHGLLSFNNGTAETLGLVGLGNLDVQNRMALKAMNTRLDLRAADKDLKFFDGTSVGSTGSGIMTLATLLPAAGGRPLIFDPVPAVVQGGDTLELVIYTQDTTASVLGASTNMGLEFRGHLLKTRES